jgi:hypothetical protein
VDVEFRGAIMEKFSVHVATTGDQLSGKRFGWEQVEVWGFTRRGRKHLTVRLCTRLLTKKSPPLSGKSIQHTFFQPSLRNEVFEGCFGDFPGVSFSDHLHTEGGIPPSLSPQMI